MEGSTTDSMCRCCAAEGIFKDIKTSYHWMGEEEVYGDMLRECFDVKLATIEEGGICEVCITQLRNAANFKKQVLHTEKKFKRHLETRRFKPAEVKEEDGNSSDDMDRDDDSEEDEDYVPDFEMPIKTEVDESKTRKRGAKATTSRAKKSKTDSDDKSIVVRDHKAIKSEVGNSWGVTIVKVKGHNTENTIIDDTQVKTNNKSKKKDRKSEDMKVKSKKLNIKKVSVFQKPFDLSADNKPIISNEVNSTNALKIKINPPPDIIIKQIKPKTDETKPKEATLKPQKKKETINAPIQRIKIVPPPDMDFMMELDKHRFNIRTVMQYSNATPIRNHVKSGFVCCFCDAHFPKPADLKIHTIQTHTDDESKDKFFRKKAVLYSFMVKLDITHLVCNICQVPIDTLDQLISHLNSNHQKNLHTDIKNHIVCFKFDSDVMRCLVCAQEFNSFKLLSEHMNQHYTNFVCDECGAGFINRRQLLLHSDKHKVGEHKCASCDKVFQSLKRMKTHERVTHVYNSGLGTHGFRCHLCNEKFKNKKEKLDHMMHVHGVQ